MSVPPYEDVASYVKSNERAVEWQLSEIYAHRWQKAVENPNGIREETASELAEYRGLSRDVFLWLVDNGYIAVVYSEKFASLEIAFPVFRNTQWFPRWPENDTQFLGMHIPYWTEMGEKRWKYEPKGCGSEPWVIGDLAAPIWLLSANRIGTSSPSLTCVSFIFAEPINLGQR